MSKVNPFDDSPYLERIAHMRAYLVRVQETHAMYMQPYRAAADRHKDAPHKDDKPQRRVQQMTFVYLLSAGSERQPVTISTRHFAALWSQMNHAA